MMPTLHANRADQARGPDWSPWPARALGRADSKTISYRAGTHRLISPEETWLALQPLLGAAGITRVADLTWLDDLGIPTVQAVRPASLTLSVSQGKAATYRAAQVSAVMESMENWHAENVTADLFRTTTTELGSGLTYDPAQLRRRSASLYHPEAKLDWNIATTLISGRPTWVPSETVLVNVAVRDEWNPPVFLMDTNGLASGNTYSEAALHGLYESMERHSLASAHPGSTLFEVPLDDVVGSRCAELVEMIQQAGSEIQIARLDSWPGFHCFTASLRSNMTEVPFSGHGLHHDPNVALSRAITEAAQSRLTAISGAREDLPSLIYDRFAQVHSYSQLDWSTRQMPTAAPMTWDVPEVSSIDDLLVSAAVAVTAETGIEPVAAVCDFAHACIPVVKVITPGLNLAHQSPMRVALEEQTP
ncbi:YcaO-like family protein [Mycobacterium gordonae]|nr:YcaO-like family protein [Mycobacterium gordonae]MCV7004227.1 YcaO-like family protein [Mycobacterium gordonae]